jgi:hypothetical protein
LEERGSCWAANPGCGVEPRKCDPCPAFKGRTTCWMFNWRPIARACTFDERNYWNEFFTKQCVQQKCPVYVNHRKEVEEFIKIFKYFDK